MKNYKLFSLITLIVLVALGAVATIMFYFGGILEEKHVVAGDELDIPQYSDMFLYWIYILVGIVTTVTLVFAFIGFIRTCITNKRRAIAIVAVVLGLGILFYICWKLGSSAAIEIPGYEGTDNVGLWPRVSDMVIYACYTLVTITFGTAIWALIRFKVLK